MIIYWKIFYADIADQKSHQRSVYLNTKNLSPFDKIFIEIALKKQKQFNNSKLFIPLRRLFITLKQDDDITFSEADDSLCCVTNLFSVYREDQDENEIDYSQFLSILRGEKITLRSGYSCLYNRSISEDDLIRSIVWDNHPLKKDDFIFSPQDVEVLKQFCADAKELQNSHFLGYESLPSFSFVSGAKRSCQIDYQIDPSERDAAYMIFRRLIMISEIACFFKAKKIVLDKRKNKHTSFDILCAKGKKIDALWNKSGEEVFFAKGILHNIPEISAICWGKFINAVLNHGLFHQKDQDETQIEYEQYEAVIDDKKTFEALFYLGVHEIAKLICDFANYVEDILNYLNEKVNSANLDKRPIAIHDEFEKFVEKKKGEFVFYLAKKNSKISYERAFQRAGDMLQEVFKGKLWD